VLALHSFFLVKTTILVGFFGLTRFMELVQIRIDEGCIIREKDGGYLMFKPKSSVNKDALVFVPSIPDKRICPWAVIEKLMEFNELLVKVPSFKSKSSNFSSTLLLISPHFLFLNPNSGGKLDSRFLTIKIKNKMGKMGIDSVRFTAYSTKHAVVTFLVDKGLSVDEIEKAMHYKQKNNTITNHYAVKSAVKKASMLLASAAGQPNEQKEAALKIKELPEFDPDIKRAESKVELIKVLNTGIWDAINPKEKEVLIKRRSEITNEIKEVKDMKLRMLCCFSSSTSTTFPDSPEFKSFKMIENIYKEQLLYVDPNSFRLEFPLSPSPIKILKSEDPSSSIVPQGLTPSEVVNVLPDQFSTKNKVYDSDGIRVSTPAEIVHPSSYVVPEGSNIDFPPLPQNITSNTSSSESNEIKKEGKDNDKDDD
jgi:hypothetical protein